MSEESSGTPDAEQAARHGVHQLGVDDADAVVGGDGAPGQGVPGGTESGAGTAAEAGSPTSGGVLEVAQFEVTPGSEEDFIAGYRVARQVLAGAGGARSVRMTRGVESPSRFTLLVEWNSVETHQAFRAGAAFADWRAPITPFMAGPPHMEHFADV